MIMMLNLNAEIFELLDKEFDLVLLWIPPHIANLLVGISGEDLIDSPRDPIGYGDLCLVGRS
jgi:hypothetical protein